MKNYRSQSQMWKVALQDKPHHLSSITISKQLNMNAFQKGLARTKGLRSKLGHWCSVQCNEGMQEHHIPHLNHHPRPMASRAPPSLRHVNFGPHLAQILWDVWQTATRFGISKGTKLTALSPPLPLIFLLLLQKRPPGFVFLLGLFAFLLSSI